MVADNLRLHICRIDAEVRSKVHAKPQTVEKRAGAEHAIMTGDASGNIGKRIGRISHGD
jgi:hypothetical protein